MVTMDSLAAIRRLGKIKRVSGVPSAMKLPRLFRFRYSLRTLLIAVTLAAITVSVVTWRVKTYLSIPSRELEGEQLLLERIKETGDSLKPYFVRGEIVGLINTHFKLTPSYDDSKLGACWKWADQRPITGIKLRNADITDLEPQIFQRFPELTHIQLFRGKYNDEQLAYLFALPQLEASP
jgi:hypothetical protein